MSGGIQRLCAQVSDIGCVRKVNEDSVYCGSDLWIVADGMGGHACGDVASRLAIETIARVYADTADLPSAIEQAHQRILQQSTASAGQKGMGTTVVALVSNAFEYEIAWVGDSRAYLWQDQSGKLTLLTQDHSLVGDMVKQGLLSNEQAQRHPKRHMVTRCLGSSGVKPFKVDVRRGVWTATEQILLCSDGLTDELNDCHIARVLQQNMSNQQILDCMVTSAKQAGGKDNISAILVDAMV